MGQEVDMSRSCVCHDDESLVWCYHKTNFTHSKAANFPIKCDIDLVACDMDLRREEVYCGAKIRHNNGSQW